MANDSFITEKSIDIVHRHALEIPIDEDSGFPLVTLNDDYFGMDDLILDDTTKDRFRYVISENKYYDKLLSYGLKPKQKILLCGPPGTGKTLSSKVLGNVMGYPFIYVEFDSIVSSFLGQTSINLKKIFNFIKKEKCVILFDEFDIVAKTRDDPQEHGEIKRAISNFMQMIDTYAGQSIIIAATNHQHLLDAAVWRRFDEVLLFKLPDAVQRRKLFEKYLRVLRHDLNFNLEIFVRDTAKFSAADIATICQNALRKSIICDQNKIKKSDLIWAIKEQKRKKDTMLMKS